MYLFTISKQKSTQAKGAMVQHMGWIQQFGDHICLLITHSSLPAGIPYLEWQTDGTRASGVTHCHLEV